MKVRKKPITLNAFELKKDYMQSDIPEWVNDALDKNKLYLKDDVWYVESMEGVLKGKIDDILIQGIDGEIYICDRDIFERTYDIVE